MHMYSKKFFQETTGGVSAEHVIVLGIIAMIAIVLSPKLLHLFESHSECMDNSSKKALKNHGGTVGQNC